MNYTKIYDRLISRARDRALVGYSERHHVLPRCMGGGNEPTNLVRLTAEEHFVAHQLLYKMHPGEIKLLLALNAMGRSNRRGGCNNKRYAWIRKRVGDEMRRRKTGVSRDRAMMERIWAKTRGRKATPEQVARQKKALKGRIRSAEHCANLAIAQTIRAASEPQEKRSGRAHKAWRTKRLRPGAQLSLLEIIDSHVNSGAIG